MALNYSYLFNAPIGDLYGLFSEKGLQRLDFATHPRLSNLPDKSDGGLAATMATQAPAIQQWAELLTKELHAYFEGVSEVFTVPLDLQGTAFQQKAWAALLEIPYGQTCAYQAQARRMGQASAVRAVGSANGKNPISIIVPCHRVIQSGGGLGGYASGTAIKSWLLAHEKRYLRSS